MALLDGSSIYMRFESGACGFTASVVKCELTVVANGVSFTMAGARGGFNGRRKTRR